MIGLSNDVIREKRKEISELLLSQSANIRSSTISKIEKSDLELLFHLYDRIFLEDWFQRFFKGRMKFSLSKRMTKSAGLTICPKNIGRLPPEQVVIEIRIGIDFFLQYGLTGGKKAVGGIRTENSLEALLLVFEHELCHAMEFIQFKKSSCKGQRFKSLAFSLFGHTESVHRLPTQRQIASQRLGLRIGDTVSFPFQGSRLTGTIYNINKRATVMVRNIHGDLIDKKGNRYSKFYVPITLLKP